MAVTGDWIQEICTTVGTGDLSLETPIVGFASFIQALPAGSVWYSIYDTNGNREVGFGTFNGMDSINRTAIHATFIDNVYEANPVTPISLSGNSIVSCTLNARAYEDLANPIIPATDVTYDSSIDPVTNEITVQGALQDHSESIEERDPAMTGLHTGGTISLASGNLFNVAAGAGQIYDSYTNPQNTSVLLVQWGDKINVPVFTDGEEFGNCHVFVDNAGELFQFVGPIIFNSLRDFIFLGNVYFDNTGDIVEVIDTPAVIKQTSTDLYDFMFFSLQINGADIRPVAGELEIWNRPGNFFFPNVNWAIDRKNPNVGAIVQLGDALTGVPLTTVDQNGNIGVTAVAIPQVYNPIGGTLTALTGQKATIHRIYTMGIKSTRRLFLLYGQNQYSNASVASDNLLLDSDQTIFPVAISSLNFLGHVCVSNSASDFSDPGSAWIVSAGSESNASTLVPTQAIQISYDNTSSGLVAGDVQAAIDETFGELDTRLIWGGTWTGGVYEPNTAVRDGNWTMVSLVTTTDRPAPQASADPENTLPDSPPWNNEFNTSNVTSGQKYTFAQSGWIRQLRVWLPELGSNIDYLVYVVNLTNPSAPVTSTYTVPSPIVNEWNIVSITNFPILVGQVYSVTLNVSNSSVTNDWTHPWVRTNNSNAGAPASGQWLQNNSGDILRINQTDNLSANRDAQLQLVENTVIRITDQNTPANINVYRIIGAFEDKGAYYEYPVTLVSSINGGPNVAAPCDVFAREPVPSSAAYVEQTTYWSGSPFTWATIEGQLFFDSVIQGGTSDNAYGVDIEFVTAYVSPDWELLAVSGEGGAGGGGEGIAAGISYNNSVSGLDATDVQAAIDELNDEIGDVVTEAISLIAGQVVVNFIVQTTSDASFYVSGLNTDTGHLWSPQDYTAFGPTAITLTKSYPAGTVITLVKRDVAGNPLPVPVFDSETLINGQTTVIFSTVFTGNTEFYLIGLNVDSGRLFQADDYTVSNSTTIELLKSYPAGTKVKLVN